VGKWHLGSAPAYAPWARGFDESFGFIGGGHRFAGWQPNERQYTLPLIREGVNIQDTPAHLTTALGEEAAGFIRRNKDKPWMLYLPFNAPHTPHEPSAERLAKFAHIENPQRRKYLAQVSLLDDAIGATTAALSETGQTERTLIFFFSDNGGHTQSGSNNSPLREIKGTLYEGGVRVPFLVSWPAELPAGTDYDQPVSTLDVFATSLAAAGVAMPADRKFDGVNLIPKLVRNGDAAPELYDLAADIAEANDVEAENAEVVARLTAALEPWNKELIDPVFPGSSVKNEDWGPGGANQKNAPKKKAAKP
jgi:arylsulfatase A-like enzyme